MAGVACCLTLVVICHTHTHTHSLSLTHTHTLTQVSAWMWSVDSSLHMTSICDYFIADLPIYVVVDADACSHPSPRSRYGLPSCLLVATTCGACTRWKRVAFEQGRCVNCNVPRMEYARKEQATRKNQLLPLCGRLDCVCPVCVGGG